MFKKIKDSEALSLPTVKKMYGVEVKKMPCGKYFEAIQTLRDLPQDFMKELSGENQNFKISEILSVENIGTIMTRLLVVLPDFTFKFLSKLMDISEEKLRNELSPKELLDIIIEFWKMNDLESFFDQMKSIMEKATTLIGFKKQ